MAVTACQKAPTPTVVPAASSTPTPSAPAAPAPGPAVQAIYEGYAKSPNGFDRVAHFSRFYVDDNRRIDAACSAGEDHPRCRGDRFSCVAVAPKKSGRIVDAVVAGEQAGVSASVKVTTDFSGTKTVADVDAVFEDGQWKVDQVRCGW